MSNKPLSMRDATEDLYRGPFDPAPEAEAELWFLPTLDADHEPIEPLGLKQPKARLFDPALWAVAQAEVSSELAALTLLFGALDERLRSAPAARRDGWRQRLALLEVADLSWWTGERLAMDQLALWIGQRIGATGETAQALIRAGWAVRRLASGAGPDAGGWEPGISVFLGRGDGARVPEAIADLAGLLEAARGLHPVTQSAMLFHGWRILGSEAAPQGFEEPQIVRQGATTDVEAAVMAARHGATAGRGGALFLPSALTGSGALRASGTETERLHGWVRGATQATHAALLHLDRLDDWEARATEATADLSGRTPALLIAALSAWPALSAPQAEEITGASRAATQRNLDLFHGRGLVREVTGQGRFRLWAASV